jgi:ketosteroid isomerase-like protein
VSELGLSVEGCGREAVELHRRQLRRLLEKDMDAWVEAFAEDAVFELPFAPPGYPQRLEGKELIREYVKDYPAHIDLQDFPEVVEHPTLDPGVLIVEARTEGRVVATGAPYRVRYVWVVTVKDGKIVHQRDYWDPLAVLDALGGEQALQDAFNVKTD